MNWMVISHFVSTFITSFCNKIPNIPQHFVHLYKYKPAFTTTTVHLSSSLFFTSPTPMAPAPQLDHHLHFLLIPLMSQSHIIPLTDFAKLLAHRGLTVSIITTPRNFTRYRATIDHAAAAGLKIQMLSLEFPAHEAGLPQDCENMDSLASMDSAFDFFAACEMLAPPLQKLITELHPKPSCIVSTNALPWTQKVADMFNIPRYIFETISCFTLDQTRQTTAMASDSEPFLKHNKTKSLMNANIETILDQIRRARSSSRATLVNSFVEMEEVYVEGYKNEARKLWCIGPVSLSNKNPAEKLDRGAKASLDEQYYRSWLDSKEPGSVIYACFGSLCRISAAQLREIGLGLEASGLPFIWIIRGIDFCEEVERWLEEEGVEERVEGRGLIIRGWAPQVLILSHPSVGGFLTHCGWNSTLEGVSAGVPMITWPMFAEQFYNEEFIVDVLKIGVRVGVGEKKAFVKWEGVKRSIQELMDGDDEEGRERRERARELAGKAREALERGGSSYINISLFIQDVVQYLTTT